jgi:patatin-like phospholipase/acyl hydrolase
MENIRSWADGTPDDFDPQSKIQSLISLNKSHPDHNSNNPAQLAILALSGGGDSGAFRAGLLSGRSQMGDRPKFQMVTGVSTGAMIAPFAFLGSEYDDQLEHFYTRTISTCIFDLPFIPNFLKGQSLTHSTPLARQIDANITEEVLSEIAKEHAAGLRLMMVTTNLEAGRAVLWDMGAIAAIGGPEATSLFRKVMLASASIPGLIQPVQIEVAYGLNTYTELHVDGGITANDFAYQSQLEIGNILRCTADDVQLTLYVIRNGRMNSVYDPPPLWYNLMECSMGLMLTASTNAEFDQIYAITKRDGLAFRLASIPDDYPDRPAVLFDQVSMQGLFAYGENLARQGYEWQRTNEKPLTSPHISRLRIAGPIESTK